MPEEATDLIIEGQERLRKEMAESKTILENGVEAGIETKKAVQDVEKAVGDLKPALEKIAENLKKEEKKEIPEDLQDVVVVHVKKGKDSDPKEVAEILKADEAFKKELEGKPGETPSDEKITGLIKPLIPAPIPGKNYELTEKDRAEIASKIQVPVVEKVIEITKVETPIVKEVAMYETGDAIVAKINAGEAQINAARIVGLFKPNQGGSSKSVSLGELTDVSLSTTPTNGQALVYDSALGVWKPGAVASGGGTWGSITGTLADQTDLQSALDAKANIAGSLTQFVGNTAWRVFYSDANGDVTELALGASGTFLQSNGAAVAPSWATAAGSGDVTKVGTPVNNQVGVWTGDGTLEGDTALTFDTATDLLSTGGLNLSGLTASEIVITDGSKNLASAAVATYPSLTELAYVKGVTSAIQTQIADKVSGPGSSVDNELARFDSTTGKIIQGGSGWTLSDAGNMIGEKLGLNKTPASGTVLDLFADGSTYTQGIRIENDITSRAAFNAYVTGDAQLRFSFRGDGRMTWGDGTSSVDTNLYRSAADTLMTDDNFVAVGTITGSNLSGTNTGNQTITNSSDATSHTVTLSASGGSVQLIEGSNITLTTGGTGSAGTVTIAATGGSLADGDYGDITVSGSGTVMSIDAATVGITELSATGTPSSSTYLRGDNTWATVAGTGDVSKVGTPVNNQIGVWTGDGTLEGDTALTFDTTTDTLAIAASGKVAFGAVNILDDAAGTTTLSNIDALDATTEATVEAAIDTLANLTSIQGLTVTLSDATFDVVAGWDDSAGAYKNFLLADLTTEAAPASGDYLLIYGAEGDLRKANWSTLPSGGATAWGSITGTLSSQTDLQTALDAKASTALSNLASVAINTTLVSDTDNTDALGTTAIAWSDLFLGSGAVIQFNSAPSTSDVTITHSANLLTIAGGDLALGANNLTMTGSIGATGARATKLWTADLESTNMPTVGGTAILTSLTAPQFTTIELGHATDTTLSRVSAGVVAIEGVNIETTATTANSKIASVGITIDGGGSAITTGIKGDIMIPYACTINSVTMLADQSGSIVVDIWKDTYANYPATDADSITASAVPTITTATKSQDTTLTGWTTSISAGDTIRFNVDSASTITRCTLVLKVTKT